MNRIIVLDTGVLGLVAHPHDTPESMKGRQWMKALMAEGDEFVLPEIADYELRRELLLRKSTLSLNRLDVMATSPSIIYVPLTTPALRQAAVFWAEVRLQGLPTADRHALDGDVILAAQAVTFDSEGREVVVATDNVKHLARFVDARLWDTIVPEGTAPTENVSNGS
jgi:hypothetical protein